MTSISKNMDIGKLDHIVNKYNKIFYRTIKMKPGDINPSTYFNSSKEINDEDSKFEIGDIVRILKYKSIFAKGYVRNWSQKVFVIAKVKNTVPWTYVINNLNGEVIIKTF